VSLARWPSVICFAVFTQPGMCEMSWSSLINENFKMSAVFNCRSSRQACEILNRYCTACASTRTSSASPGRRPSCGAEARARQLHPLCYERPHVRTVLAHAKIVKEFFLLGPVAQESVVDSALLRSIFRPFKPAFLYTTCTQNRREERATLLLGCSLHVQLPT
jgi:hypothetical protein